MPHDGPHDGHGHTPPAEPDDRLTRARATEIALRELMVAKGIVTPAEIAAQIAKMDARGPHLGARIVARAWTDPAYKARLIADGSAACREMGVEVDALKLVAVENTAEAHNMIVCTLCSCYPRNLLGLPPDWYKSRPYRSRAVREPRRVLAEFGLSLPEGTALRVHDSTADMRYLVVPRRPDWTEGWDEARLAGVVTRDCMIGVAVPQRP